MSESENDSVGEGVDDSEEKFRILTEASPDCIKIFDSENRLRFMSRGGLEEHGFKELKEAIGFDWTETVVPEQREEVRGLVRESVRSKKPMGIDVKHLPEYANREWCSLIVKPVFDEAGKLKYILGISRDISEHKRSERELTEIVDRQDRILKAAVSRELTMADLKKEIAELKSRK